MRGGVSADSRRGSVEDSFSFGPNWKTRASNEAFEEVEAERPTNFEPERSAAAKNEIFDARLPVIKVIPAMRKQ